MTNKLKLLVFGRDYCPYFQNLKQRLSNVKHVKFVSDTEQVNTIKERINNKTSPIIYLLKGSQINSTKLDEHLLFRSSTEFIEFLEDNKI